jgi:hypothetical protein
MEAGRQMSKLYCRLNIRERKEKRECRERESFSLFF